MNPRELERLLGGYATNSLTEQERNALFESALHDQKLFDALADEEALRELLADPAARGELLTALAEPVRPRPAFARCVEWLMRPSGFAALGATAAVVLVLVYITRPSAEEPKQIAMVRESRPMAKLNEVPSAAAPAPVRPSPSGARVAKVPGAAPVQTTAPVAPKPVQAEPSRVVQDFAQPPAEAEQLAKGKDEGVAGRAAGAPATPAVPAPELAASSAVQPARTRPPVVAEKAGAMDRLESRTGAAQVADFRRDKKAVAELDQAPLRYLLERREPDGTWAKADPNAVFSRGDRMRIQVEPASAGVVSFQVGALPAQSQAVRPGVQAPLEEFVLDDPSGESRVTLQLGAAAGNVMLTRMKAREENQSRRQRADAPAGQSVTITLRYR